MTKAAENETAYPTFLTSLNVPPPRWKVEIFPGYEYRMAGNRPVPYAFHRLMQRLVFGFKWERIK
jgi:hypothetical protein